jgi:mycothiol synthase
VTPRALRLRPARDADADGVAALVNQRELIDRGVAESTGAAVSAHWATPGIEVAADGLIGELDGRIVGAALATRDREHVYVDTAHEGRGLGTRLRDWVMARSVCRGAAVHRQIIGADHTPAAALLSDAGYARVRSFHRMRRSLPLNPDPATASASGIVLRRVDGERDARALHRLDAAAFADNADYAPETFEQFRAEHLVAPDRDPAATLVATDGDRVVGFLIAARRRGGSAGYISILGVDPGVRRRGVATALLHAAFASWTAAGVATAELTVASDNPRAIALYAGLGMAPAYTLDCWERPITSAR